MDLLIDQKGATTMTHNELSLVVKELVQRLINKQYEYIHQSVMTDEYTSNNTMLIFWRLPFFIQN